MYDLFSMIYFHLFDLGWTLNLCSSALDHIAFFQEADGMKSSIQVS